MLGLLLLAACIWFGFSLLRLTGVALGPEQRWVAGPPIGTVVGMWTIFAVSSVAGRLSWATITGSLVVFVLVWFVARRCPSSPGSLHPAPWFLLLTACLAVPLVWMNAYGVLAPVPEGVAAVEHI